MGLLRCCALSRRNVFPVLSESSLHAPCLGFRALSSAPTLAARAPLNQRLSKWEAKTKTQGVYNQIKRQESVQHDYSTDDGDILSTLSNMGVKNFRVAERILRLHRSELVAAGYSPAQAAHVVRTSSKWKADYLAEMSPLEVAILTDHANLGTLFFVAAMTDLSRTNQMTYLRLGSMSLKVAFELGNGDAAVEFAKLELRTRGVAEMGDPDALSKPVDLPPNILDYIRRAAMARKDWRSMCLYLDYSLRKPQPFAATKALYQLAVDLSTMARPSLQTVDQVIPSERLELPWFLLQKAADQYYAHLSPDSDEAADVQRNYAEALNIGRDRWNDSRAAELLLRNTEDVKPGSPRWVELLTQAAMQGNPDFCFRLGDHRLREEGWHPETRKWRKPSDRTSLWWIELSAYGMRHFPIKARQRYLLLAVLLRENGFNEEATAYLARGQAALRESDSPEAETSIQWLQDTIDYWDDPEWQMTSTILLNAEPLYKQRREEEARRKCH